MMEVLSPVTGKPNVRLVDSISVDEIVSIYKREMNVCVKRFFVNVDEVQICKCLDTDYLFYYPFSICGDEAFYDELKVNMPVLYGTPYYSSWKWEYGFCKNFIKKTDIVYEIGAGSGFFLDYLKKNGVENVSGSELNHDSIADANEKGLSLEYKTVEEKATEAGNRYDVVCTFQVLEHVASVKSFLESAIKILKPGGKLIIAVPYNSPYLFKYDKLNMLNMPPHHMGLWNKSAFKRLQNVFSIKLENLIIENLPNSGYDFDRYYEINKDKLYPKKMPLKKIFDGFFFKWLKKYHYNHFGKNIIAVYSKGNY